MAQPPTNVPILQISNKLVLPRLRYDMSDRTVEAQTQQPKLQRRTLAWGEVGQLVRGEQHSPLRLFIRTCHRYDDVAQISFAWWPQVYSYWHTNCIGGRHCYSLYSLIANPKWQHIQAWILFLSFKPLMTSIGLIGCVIWVLCLLFTATVTQLLKSSSNWMRKRI